MKIRQKTVRAFEAWKLDPKNLDEFFGLIVEKRRGFRDACFDLKQPYRLMFAFFHDGGEMQARYDAALQAVARDYMDETIGIADSVRKTKIPARVGAAKIAIEARQAYAKTADKERFGDSMRLEKSVEHGVDSALLGAMGDLLALAARGAGRVVEGTVLAQAAGPAAEPLRIEGQAPARAAESGAREKR